MRGVRGWRQEVKDSGLDGGSGLGLRDPHKSKMRWEEGGGCGGQTAPAGTRQGERKNHRGGAGPVGRLQRGRRPCKKGRGWRLRGAGDTSAGSGSPGLPASRTQEGIQRLLRDLPLDKKQRVP